jgi:hypothetical protein
MGFNEVNCKQLSKLCGPASKRAGKKGRHKEAAYSVSPSPGGEGGKNYGY